MLRNSLNFWGKWQKNLEFKGWESLEIFENWRTIKNYDVRYIQSLVDGFYQPLTGSKQKTKIDCKSFFRPNYFCDSLWTTKWAKRITIIRNWKIWSIKTAGFTLQSIKSIQSIKIWKENNKKPYCSLLPSEISALISTLLANWRSLLIRAGGPSKPY